jgi:hypothetical protein
MSWTLDFAVGHIRELLQDKDSDAYRNSDEEIVGVINYALVESRKLRPDLYIPGIYAYVAPSLTAADLATDPLTELPIDDMYQPAIVEYTVGYISMEDDEFALDGRAVQLLNRFSQKMVGKGA